MEDKNKITIRSLLVGFVIAGIFAVVTVYFENRRGVIITACQIPVASYFLLFLTVLLLNPLCSVFRFVRRFSVAEIMTVFIMGLVSSGLSTFGLAAQLMPVMGGFFNHHWNTEQSEWNKYVTPYVKEGYFLAAPGIQEAAQEYNEAGSELDRMAEFEPERIAEQEEIVEQRRAALKELEKQAFDRVELFRRGLPDGMRAFPGFVPLPEEGIHIYLARVRRFSHGLSAAGDLREGLELTEQREEGEKLTAELIEPVVAKVTAAIDSLALVTDPGETMTRKESLSAQWQELNEQTLQMDGEIRDLSRERAIAPSDQLKILDREIGNLSRRIRELDRDKQKVSDSRHRAELELEATRKVGEVTGRLEELRDRAGRGEMEVGAFRGEVGELLAMFPAFDASLSSFVIGDIPWSHWMKPLARWALVIGLTYVVLMTFNLLIFRQWAHNERLIYPLAQLPELLIGADTDTQYPSWPPIFRSGLFWK